MGKFTSIKWWWLTLFLTVPLLALAEDVPHLFKSGDVISSLQVNENFKSLADRLTALEAGQANPWVLAGPNVSKAAFDDLAAKYPYERYEWGIAYNVIPEPRVEVIHRVTVSSWNGGIRVTTEEFLQGDGQGTGPPDIWMGGAAWFFGTQGSFDDACNLESPPSFTHYYWRRSGTGITFFGSNGCANARPDPARWYVRRR